MLFLHWWLFEHLWKIHKLHKWKMLRTFCKQFYTFISQKDDVVVVFAFDSFIILFGPFVALHVSVLPPHYRVSGWGIICWSFLNLPEGSYLCLWSVGLPLASMLVSILDLWCPLRSVVLLILYPRPHISRMLFFRFYGGDYKIPWHPWSRILGSQIPTSNLNSNPIFYIGTRPRSPYWTVICPLHCS